MLAARRPLPSAGACSDRPNSVTEADNGKVCMFGSPCDETIERDGGIAGAVGVLFNPAAAGTERQVSMQRACSDYKVLD